MREEVMHEERRARGAPIVRRHQRQLRAEPAVQQFGECRHGGRPNSAMHFPSSPNDRSGDEPIAFRERAKERVKAGGHGNRLMTD